MMSQDLEKVNLPDAPGVYFWKLGKKIVYVGRATSLRDRVRSYFAADVIATRGPRIVDMVTKATKIDFERTDSVLEAIILEANLIKKYQPVYNVKEKDDRSFNYVVITKEEFPKVIIVRGKNLKMQAQKSAAIFGPFPNSSALRAALHIVRKMFPFFDEKSGKRYQTAFYRQLHLTPETAEAGARKEYLKNIQHIKIFFEGKKGVIIRLLTKEMKALAKNREFEKAGEIKRKIFALTHIRDVALIKEEDDFPHSSAFSPRQSAFRIEAYDIAHTSGKESVGVMTVLINGTPDKNEYRKFRISKEIGNNDTKSLAEVLTRRLNHPEWTMPDVVVIDGGKGQLNTARKVFSDKKLSAPPTIISVVKTDAHKPRAILGMKFTDLPAGQAGKNLEKSILLANAEAHRFAITYHRKLRQFGKRNLF
ncbi:MAG TPA: hypothetical protein VMR73_01095 [Candidatus Paceibacterota bacterium]|nr:hypothetical protein [Candidatus Paceibacterota bacterium]